MTPGTSDLKKEISTLQSAFWPFYLLFFLSGAPALLYQIVWQRALFTIYGVNIESVTIIVAMFMLGLGLGSIVGGRLSSISGMPSLRIFGLFELGIAAFGMISLHLFHAAAQFSAGQSNLVTGFVTFALLLIPTIFMGGTLPLLVAHLVKVNGNVGRSVGSLYAANTFGSGVACWLAASFLMRTFGESGVVHFAAALNLLVGAGAVIRSFVVNASESATGDTGDRPTAPRSGRETISLTAALCVSAAAGFVALGYEIIWYRVYSFASGGAAPAFAKLLAFYLIGIAYGSLAVHDVCEKKLKNDLNRTLQAASLVIASGAATAFLIEPCIAALLTWGVPLDFTYPLVSIAAALLAAVFPLISHAAIDPNEEAGKKVSYLYLGNIVGSTLGSFLIGFTIMDYLSTRGVTTLLLVFGFIMCASLAMIVRPLKRSLLIESFLACVLLILVSKPLFAHFYERLFLKSDYHAGYAFRDVLENRNGVITVDTDERVYGGGIYDGQFNIDPVTATNGLFRVYAIPAFHPQPEKVLVIGLASGSWAQILANYSKVNEMTIVEINPGYLPLIRQRPNVTSLIDNPKVHIEIDDGRRWLISHPDRKFDFILMNTSYNWRAHMSNLLSTEFMQILHQHLLPGGVAYYNTTSSGRVQLTGATSFPYALRLSNFLAVSDRPIVFDRAHCEQALTNYTLDGRRVFDLSNPADRRVFDSIVSMPLRNSENIGKYLDQSIEDRSSLLNRLSGDRLITDDNMGTEWP
ncbi:MAG TPA: fused MFS/spermidine synthase [Terracidiphilus sp.]|jgi:predicted membrane-bound spermidine synthase